MDGGYGNQYSSYGGGGGFMPGEMNSPAGGKSDANNPTLRPVTVKQALDATQPYPEANFHIDGADAASIFFIGQVRNISSQSVNITYKIDDGTGEIEVKQWPDSASGGIDEMDTDDNKSSKPKVEQNGYVKVFGKLKAFGNKRYVNAHCVRPLTDINELHYHLLEATAVHLFFTRGPPGGASSGAAGAATGAAAEGGMAEGDGGRALPPLSPVARRIYNLLKSEPQSNEGLHAQHIAAKLGLPVTDVMKGGDELLNAGVIFSTFDEMTWAILEY
ncbi:Replication factor A protein 2 [Paecilomyces lecythidis]